MSDMKNFDDHLKKSFSNYMPSVPPHIWDNITAAKKRRPAAFWLNRKSFSAAILIIALSGGMLLFIKNQKQASKIITGENKAGSNQIITPPAVIKGNTTGVPDNSESTKGGREESMRSTAGNDEPVNGKHRNLSYINPLNGNEKNMQAKNILKNKFITGEAGNDKNNAAPFALQSVKKQQSNTEKTGVAAGENNTPAGNSLQSGLSMSRLPFDAEKLAASALLNPVNKITAFKKISIPGCPSDNMAGNKQYWEIYAGPDHAFKKYADTANSVLLEKRKASTSFQSAFSAGIRYTRVFSNGMSLRGGFNFSQVNEKFSYAQSNVVQLNYEISQSGDTINSYYVRGIKYKTAYNHYRTLDIPLMIGYELGNGRLHANINAGAVINIYSWQKGETLDTTLQPVSFTSGKTNIAYQYKTNTGLGFMGAVSVYYKINERLHLLAEPYYRYNFSPMNKETLSLQEKFSTFGVKLGVRIDL